MKETESLRRREGNYILEELFKVIFHFFNCADIVTEKYQ